MRIAGALLLGLGIGVTCRFLGIPLPSSPALVGATLVVAITVRLRSAGGVGDE